MNPPLQALCLAGPTASGKSAAALALAEVERVEIISVDSAQVYRGMDIGTAKPTLAQRARVPHHLIDIRDPRERYSAARFADDARRLVSEIRARGHLPLLVGGTMLYFKALFDGLDALPEADAQVRADIDALADAQGWPAVHAELARVDAQTARRLAPQDAQRLQRALEVYRITGRPLSQLHTGTKAGRPPAALVSLEPMDRHWLHDRIAERLQAMLRDGLLEEVRALHRRGDLSADLPAMRCVGYRQAWEALDQEAETGRADTTLAARAVAATRQLAKRQLTWLRAMPARQVIACDAPGALDRAVDALRRAAATLQP